MPTYEAVFVLRPDLDEEALGRSCERFMNLVGANRGTVLAVEKMGHRRLAYEVKGFRDGFYVVLYYEGQSETVRELERNFKISDEVIRYINVRREAPYRPAQAKEEAKAEAAPETAPAEPAAVEAERGGDKVEGE
ncbi:MAG: 30S ribosomal protein S6 [Firmicutes bacterium]|nr:30S ribosomal protein S6 [Bacillota bacterium]